MAKIIEVILAEEGMKGTGQEGDPYRRITQLWTKKGELIAEYDPCGESNFNPKFIYDSN